MAHYLFYVIVSMSAFCLGWRTITSEGMIFGWLRLWCIDHMHPMIAKPFILCVTCLSSVWGTVIFWCFFIHLHKPITKFIIFEWIISCIICSFINTFAWNLKTLIEKQSNK